MNSPITSAKPHRNVLRAYVLPILLTCLAVGTALPARASSSVKVAPATGHPSQVITVSATGFGDSEAVDVYFDTVDTLLLVTTATGTFTGPLTLPTGASPGAHYVTAIGRRSGDAAQITVNISTPWVELGFGAGHLGLNPYENTLNSSNVAQLGQLWSVPTGGFTSAVSVVNHRAYAASYSPGGVQALSATTGAVLWNAQTSVGFNDSPAVVGGVVYIGGTTSTTMYALNATTGATKWTQTLGGAIEASAVVVNGIVYVGCDDAHVYALNATTGAIVWTFATGSDVQSTPAVVNGVLYVGSYDHSVYALNAATGAEYWSFATSGLITGSPAVVNGRVFVGSGDGYLYALSAADGQLLWSASTNSSIVGSPAVASNRVYVGSDKLYSFNARTGALEWADDLGAGIEAAPIVANGVVYIGTESGDLVALDAFYGDELVSMHYGLAILASPAVSDGVVYVTAHYGNTAAFALGAGVDAVPQHAVNAPKPASLVPDMSLKATLSLSPSEAKALSESEE